tara:strand:+ start:1913 stop:2317 length:405 start_codon:yes stop_codon:yes gene_type:complete
MIDEYDESGHVGTSEDFLRCQKCRSTELTMNTTSMSHGIVQDVDGVVCEFTCNKCGTELALALYNDDVGNPQLTTRINWVQKVAPYVPTAIDKLNSYSLTGYSKKLKQHADKYDLWDVEIGSDAHVPFNAKDYN